MSWSKNKPVVDFSLAVSNGDVPGWSTVDLSGKSTGLTTGSFQTVWDGNPSDEYLPPTQDRLHNIASASIEDNPAGTGASSVFIQGVSSITDGIISELIDLNGTTDVPTTKVYSHIHRMTVLTWGSGASLPLSAAGDITAAAQVDSTPTAIILAGRNNNLSSVFQVPRDKNLLLTSVTFSIFRAGGSTASATFRFILFRQGEGFIESVDVGLDDSSPIHTVPLEPSPKIGPNTYFMGQANPDVTNTTVDVNYRGYLAPIKK